MSSSWQHIASGIELAASLASDSTGTLYLPTPIVNAAQDGVYRLPPGTWVLGRRQTLVFGAGAQVGAQEGGATLVAAGHFTAAPDQHIFEVGSATARLSVRCLSGSVQQVYPPWWGATAQRGRGISDADAIEELLGAIAQDGVDTVVFPATATYQLDRTVTLLPGKRYTANHATFLAGSPNANPLFTLSSQAWGKTELSGFDLRGAGYPITLLAIRPSLADLTLTVLGVLDPSRSGPLVADLPQSPLIGSPDDLRSPWSPLPTNPIPVIPSPPAGPALTLQPVLTAAHERTLSIQRCEFRNAAAALTYLGSLNVRLSDCTMTDCSEGLQLDVIDGRFEVERVGVRPVGAAKSTEVKLRLRSGALRMTSVTVDGRLSAEVEAGLLEVRGGRFGFASFGPLRQDADSPLVSAGRVVVADCVFDGVEPVRTPTGTQLVTVHLRMPYDVFLQDLNLRTMKPQSGTVGVLVQWAGQRAGSVLIDGCVWEGGPASPGVADTVAVHNIDLANAAPAALTPHRLVLRSCALLSPFDCALRLDGGNVELDGCALETRVGLWVRQWATAGRQVVTLRSPSFSPPEVLDGAPLLYARFEQRATVPLSLILVHEDVVLDAEQSQIETEGVSAATLAEVTVVGRRVIEGMGATPGPAVSGFVGDIYRVLPLPQTPGATALAESADLVCVRTGRSSGATWKPYCRTALEAP